ncbi:MAG: DUF932 domain-containing protein [Planctomycetia bacterium]|nr:DUF932 domain-containing protein [Planctomycetia bacterium]
MQNLTRAHDELYLRGPDERFDTLSDLWRHCQEEKERSVDRWHPPQAIKVEPAGSRCRVVLGEDGNFNMNEWSFSQLCRLAGVNKDTLNRVSAATASQIFFETLPPDGKPLQALTVEDTVRAIHGAAYTRLYNCDLLSMVREFATDFQPPQTAATGGTGLYCGEQDMFVFLIDPAGWTEIDGEAFAPGFFLWNSEVGRRSVGVQTFWFQAVCANHIVWDAVEIVEFTRKHTANVHECFGQIREIIGRLVEKRDQRRDGFVATIRKAMETTLGRSADDVLKVLAKQGIPRAAAKEAVEIAAQRGRFTIFCVVDALTRLAGKIKHAGDRTEADERASALLALAA